MRHLLGIDLGTSGLKAAVFDLDGALLGLGRATNEYVAGPAGWAEQDPRTWWTGCCQAVQIALAQAGVKAADVVAVGVCGFHHCPVFLDAEGIPVRPTIVTHDERLGESLADLDRSGILDDLEEISGSRVTTGHFPPIYQLVRTHDPQALERTRWILLAKDYLRFRLTGQIGTELCDATGTNLIAMPEQVWSAALCTMLQVPRYKLPQIGRSSQLAGYVTPEAARATGLEPGTAVGYGGGDSHCALVGLGVIGSGEAGLLLGSNSTLRASFDSLLKPGQEMVWIQQHVAPGRFTVSASSMAGSSVLSWFRGVCFGEEQEGEAIYRELESLAASAPAGCGGLLFHPYLFGERSPFHNPEARGAFLGIRHWHGKEHLVRSVMEGVAFSIANCMDAIQAIAHKSGERINVLRTGKSGGSRLSVWRQIIADALDHPLEVADVDEPGCLGAAVLAGLSVGLYDGLEPAIQRTVQVTTRAWPDPVRAALYRDQRSVFNKTYLALESHLYHRSGQVPAGG
ncbi:MAG TPA: FGGY family carbohydrate kinase [Anaerolineae bacterium]|nr:FGGY family carbohydrate kinase [Anaerolineae bacterium]